MEGGVVGGDDVVVIAIKAEGEISAWAKFHHAVHREILRVVFQIVPVTWLNGSHVGSSDVNVVLNIGHAGLVLAPLSMEERRTVMPAEDAFFPRVVETGPEVSGHVPIVPPRGVEPRILGFVVHGHEETVQSARGLGSFCPR